MAPHRATRRIVARVHGVVVAMAVVGILSGRGSPAADAVRPTAIQAAPAAQAEEASRPHDPRLTPPSAAEQKAAAGLVREVFGAEAAKATTPEAKSGLAKKLIDQAADGVSPTEAYVLLTAAQKLAAESGDVAGMTAAVEALAGRFAIDGRAVLLDSLEMAATKAPVRELTKTVDALLAYSREEADADRMDRATAAAQLAANAARRANDGPRRQACAEQLQSLKALARQMAEIQPLLDRLRENPADAVAAGELGRIRCFGQGRWEEGLPLLARGDSTALANLAKLEADKTASALERGDAWWALGGDDREPHAGAARSRAAFHYAAALADLKGLEKARIEKRLQDFAAEDTAKGKSRRPRPPAPGLVLWLDASDAKSIRTANGAVLDRVRGPARIAAWGDLSGAGHAAYQNVPERQPLWTPDGFSKLPAVEFNGKSGLVIDMPCAKAGTIVLVARPGKVDSMRALGCHPAGVEHGTCLAVCFRPNGNFLFQATTANPTGLQQTSAPSYAVGDSVVISAMWGGRIAMAINGRNVAEPRPLDNFTPLPGPWGIGLTVPTAAVEPFVGAVAEAMVFERDLEPAAIDAIVRQLTLKWAAVR